MKIDIAKFEKLENKLLADRAEFEKKQRQKKLVENLSENFEFMAQKIHKYSVKEIHAILESGGFFGKFELDDFQKAWVAAKVKNKDTWEKLKEQWKIEKENAEKSAAEKSAAEKTEKAAKNETAQTSTSVNNNTKENSAAPKSENAEVKKENSAPPPAKPAPKIMTKAEKIEELGEFFGLFGLENQTLAFDNYFRNALDYCTADDVGKMLPTLKVKGNPNKKEFGEFFSIALRECMKTQLAPVLAGRTFAALFLRQKIQPSSYYAEICNASAALKNLIDDTYYGRRDVILAKGA